MGFLDRSWKILTGLGGAIQAFPGYFKDIGTAAFTDDEEIDGFIGDVLGDTLRTALWRAPMDRGAQVLSNLFGPDEGIGAAIGGLPEQPIPGVPGSGVRSATGAVFEGLETAGREGIREPLATLQTASHLSLAEDTPLGRVGAMFRGDTWREAYAISQNRSVGQAVTLGLLNVDDITDQAEVNRAVGTDLFNIMSGTVDAIARVALDADIVLAKGGTALHVMKNIRPITSAERAAAAAFDGKVVQVLDDIHSNGLSAAQIRDKYFPDHDYGAPISDILARAARADDTGAAPLDMSELRRLRDWLQDNWQQANDGEVRAALREGRSTPELDLLRRGLATAEPTDLPVYRGLVDDHSRYRVGETFELEPSAFSYRQDTARGFADERLAPAGQRVVLEVAPGSRGIDVGGGQAEVIAGGRFEVLSKELVDDQWVVKVRQQSDSRDELTLAFRALVGDYDAIGILGERRADLAGELSRLAGPQEAATRLTRAGFELPQNLRDELDGQLLQETRFRYQDELERLDRILGVYAEDTVIVPRTAGAIEDLRFANTRVLQSTPGAPAVHHVASKAADRGFSFRMRPQPWINFEDVSSDIQLTRMFQRAPVSDDVADALRSEYIEQLTPGGRRRVFDRALDAVVESYGRRAGMTGDELVELVRRAQAERGKAMEELSRSRSYNAQGRGVFEVTDESGHVTQTAVPVWMTQESNFGVIPDMDALDRASRRIADHNRRFENLPDWVPGRGVTERTALGSAARTIPPELGDLFNRIWKPTVLIRPGWPMRVVSDELLRIMAKIGVLTQIGEVARAAGRWTVDAIDSVPAVVTRRKSWAEAKDRFGLRWHDVNGYRMQDARGTPADGRNVHQQLVAQTSNLNVRLFGVEAEHMDEFRRGVGDHRTFLPTESDFGSRWEHALNKQIAGDAVGRKFLQGETVEDVVRWLRTDETGRAYLVRDPLWAAARAHGKSLEDTVAIKKAALDDVTLGKPEIADKALKGEATIEDLRRLEPDAGRWMPVHGQVVADAFGGSYLSAKGNELVSKAYRALGGMPSTVLSRNRFFDHTYRAEIERLTRLAPPKSLSDDELRLIERQARDHALSEVKRWLFDVSEQSDMAQRLRFISPFFMAQQEIVTRWAGLAVENPAFVLNMRKAWGAPEKAGIVVDENGNKINANGQATSVLTGESVEAGEDRFIVLPIPEWADDLPGAQALGRARFNKEALNVALQLNAGVGTGPLVQIPVNEIVKNRPDLAASVEFMMPFGTSQDALDVVLASTLKRIRTAVEGESSEEYRNSVLRIYFDEVVNYNLGKRDTQPTYEEAKKKADAFWSMRTVASWVAPAAPWFTSPYQTHIDAYRNAETKYRNAEQEGVENMSLADAEGNPRTPAEWFLDEFGEEYFALTQHVTRTVDGIPPTVEGYIARKKYRPLIEQFPQLGGLIVGAEGAGDFSRAVYEHQKGAVLKPGSSQTQRETVPFDEAAVAPDVRLGWQEYGRLMDDIDAEMFHRGLFSILASGNADLKAIKDAAVQDLATRYPAWYEEFASFDPVKAQQKLEGLRAIATDRQLQGRDEIRGLAEYFEVRDAMAQELAARAAAGGASTLQAQANTDLRFLWDAVVNDLIERNLSFGDLYHRWLSNDLPAAGDVPMQEAA